MKPGRELDALVAEHVFGWRLEYGIYPENKHIRYWINASFTLDEDDTPFA